jgi:type II secretory ATPase GspE/PulE/Tfp pilus assembly ATPase PilB-like protein
MKNAVIDEDFAWLDATHGVGPDFIEERLSHFSDDQWQRLAGHLGLSWTSQPEPDPTQRLVLQELVPSSLANRRQLLPLKVEAPAGGDEADPKAPLHLTCHRPFDLAARQEAVRSARRPLIWHLSPPRRIAEGIQKFYGLGADTFDDILKHHGDDLSGDEEDEGDSIDDEPGDDEASMSRLVNHFLREALKRRATDIHLEPMKDRLRVRYRIDGQLQEVPTPEQIKRLQSMFLSRIKIMAGLDIGEKRLPQDGRISLTQKGRNPIDVRVAVIPTNLGEAISLRLLGAEKYDLEKLQMAPDIVTVVRRTLRQPNGIVLVTGPTGSGKSTSLYTFLSELNTEERRIVTIEDPVENQLPGVTQIAVKASIGLTFAAGLRSILRGDPNVIMVGEIRDLETAEIAIRAALTGHLVFSTLHTNDALTGITRLVEMGLEPFLVASSVRAFLAQRLVRTLCPTCTTKKRYLGEDLRSMGFPAKEDMMLACKGDVLSCETCRGTGYYGRMAVYEMVEISAALQDMITRRATLAELEVQAKSEGFHTMREYGWEKIVAGKTSVDEVVRATAGS